MNVLVTGGTGMIGQSLVTMLLGAGHKVRAVSLDDPSRAHPNVEFMRLDLTHPDNCMKACQGMDDVFHLAGIKGSPKMTQQQPASFFYPTISFNTHMMEAAYRSDVDRYLFTSSVGVYAPAEVFYEDSVWSTFPSSNDKFAGWAKRMGELQAESYKIQYGWDKIAIVRPANVYGPYDNFDPENAMVIPSLIRRICDGENPLVVWGDGSAIRDFIFADDVARGMLLAMENQPQQPINLGSGVGISIKELVDTLVDVVNTPVSVEWDDTKPSGDKKRILDDKGAKSIGFKTEVSLRDGLQKTVDWYLSNKENIDNRYNVFRS